MSFHTKKDYVGNKLFELRKDSGLNQTEVAKAVGISRSALSYYEKGERSIDIDVLYDLANYYQVSIDYLFGLTDSMTPERDPQVAEELKCIGFSDTAIDRFWNDNTLVELINDFIAHDKFEEFSELAYCTRYTFSEDYDQKYRSFLISQLLYEIITDIFYNWYKDNDSRPLSIKEVGVDTLDADIKKYLSKNKIIKDLYELKDKKNFRDEVLTDNFLDFMHNFLNYLYNHGILHIDKNKNTIL